jgi:hypothetical protein
VRLPSKAEQPQAAKRSSGVVLEAVDLTRWYGGAWPKRESVAVMPARSACLHTRYPCSSCFLNEVGVWILMLRLFEETQRFENDPALTDFRSG